MNTFFVIATSLGATLYSQIAPAQTQPKAPAKPQAKPQAKTPLTMPLEVRDMKAKGATTVYFARLPIGARGAPVLFHAWKIKRGQHVAEYYNAPSLFCIDLFSPDADRAGKWRLVSSTSYLSYASYPGGTSYKTYWLNKTKKQGLVIVEHNSEPTGAVIRVITLPKGVEAELDESARQSVQEFGESYQGGGVSSNVRFGHDARGVMTISKETIVHMPVPRTLDTYAWNGEKWARTSSREQK